MSLLTTIAIGLYLALPTSPLLLPIGLLGVILIVTYTRWLNRSPWLCLIAPGLGIGILMISGTHLVLSEQPNPIIWIYALPVFFLVNNLLLLNQYPDISADRDVGRRHLPIHYGIGTSNLILLCFYVSTFALIGLALYLDHLPRLGLLALLPSLSALFACRGALKHREKIGSYPIYLGANVITVLATPFLMAISLLFG